MKRKPTKADVENALQEIADRMEATKELAITRHAPKLVGVADEATAKAALTEVAGELLAVLDAIEHDVDERGLTTA